MTKIGAIILAAGASTRLGKPKQLLLFEGKTLLRHAAETALASDCAKICVVLGANFEILQNEISDLEIEIAVNENWASGMASSLQIGLKKLLDVEPNLAAVIVTLCDQPLIDSTIINQLIEIYQQTKSPIVAAEYAETTGVPAVFADSMFDEIMNLTADGGAKKLIEKHAASVVKIPVPEAVFDVDTSADYERLLRQV